MATFDGRALLAHRFTGTAAADLFLFTAAGLDAKDRASGAGGIDVLQLTTAGALAKNALAGVNGIERIKLAAGGNAITLKDANLAEVAGAKIIVTGGKGNDLVDAALLKGKNAIDVTAGAGIDVLKGGAGNDTFRFAVGNLFGDTVSGGLGSDKLVLTTAGALIGGGLSKVSGVETFQLAAGGNGLSFANANFTGVVGGKISVIGGAGNDSIDGSDLGPGRALDVIAGAGLDTLIGGAGADVFHFKVADLAGDTVRGGVGSDLLALSNAGVLGNGALAQMTGVETIALATGGNGIVLGNGNFGGVLGAKITVIGGAGGDSVDASKLTGKRAIEVIAGGGNDTLTGGAGDDVFRFLPTDLTAGDTIAGGAGYDTLQIIRPVDQSDRTLATDALAHMTGIDRILLAKTGTGLTLTDANYAVPVTGDVPGSDRIDIYGRTGKNVIDAADLTGTHAIYFYDGGGADAVIGGDGDDVVRYEDITAAVPGDTFDGGGGNDAILFESSMDFLGDTITNVEKLIYSGDGDAYVTISGENAARIAEIGTFGQDTFTQVYTVQFGGEGFADLSNLKLIGAEPGDAIKVVSSGGLRNAILSASISSYTGSDDVDLISDRGGAQTLILGGGSDIVYFRGENVFAAGDTIDGGAGTDTIFFDGPMDFLGDSITNVENLLLDRLGTVAAVTISGENAARIRHVGTIAGQDFVAQIYTVKLSAGSATDLSNITLDNPDKVDAIKVVATSGNTAVTLNNQIASFTGSADSDTVGYAEGGGYKNGAVISGGGGDDRIVYDGATTIDGGEGNDTLILLGGPYIFNLATGSNQLPGGLPISNFENIDASAASEGVLLGGREDVASVLIGGRGVDTIYALAAGATITGGLGGDSLIGNTGADRFHIFSTEEARDDQINGGGGDDGIDVQGNADLTGAAINSIETLFLAATDAGGTPTADDLTATVTGTQAAALTGVFGNGYNATSVETLVVNVGESGVDLTNLSFFYWSGNDHVVINGTSGDDIIIGSSANDVIHGGDGADRLSGGDGNDTIDFTSIFTFQLDGGAGSDTIRFNTGISATVTTVDLAGRSVELTLSEFESYKTLATGFENADFSNNSLKTILNGTTGDNILIGGSAADTLTGGLGADTLTGGGGADQFMWNDKLEGGDKITDFTLGTDKLVFSASAFSVGGAFDTVIEDFGDRSQSFADADLILTTRNIFNASDAQSYANGELRPSDPVHPFFLIGRGAEFHNLLFYIDGIASSHSAVLIADLGTGPKPSAFGLSDFVFI